MALALAGTAAFENAAKSVREQPEGLTAEQRLTFYAYYKQAVSGDAPQDPPGPLAVVGFGLVGFCLGSGLGVWVWFRAGLGSRVASLGAWMVWFGMAAGPS